MNFPRLYAILDADSLAERSIHFTEFAAGIFSAGVQLVQYRNKSGGIRAALDDATRLNDLRAGLNLRLIMNDRADLALLAGFDGVHVGQDDLAPEDARCIVGRNAWVGVSTHNIEQAIEADRGSCDYMAFGPVFATSSKKNPDRIVGLDSLRQARAVTRKPLVAIGGITLQNCRAAVDAGADSVAVIAGLLPAAGATEHRAAVRHIAEEFLSALGP